MSYVERVADAISSQDYRAMTALLVELSGKVDRAEAELAAAEARRAHRAELKREERRRRSPDVARQVTTDSDTPLPPSPSSSSPTPLITTSSPSNPPSASEAGELTMTRDEIALALSAAVGSRVNDVRAFLVTREPHTRTAWMKAMLKIVGPGSQFTPDDLADACNDALALDKPIDGPHALRVFVAKQREVRHKAIAGRVGPTTKAERDASRDRELRDEKTRRAAEERWMAARSKALEKWRSEHEAEHDALVAECRSKITAGMPAAMAGAGWINTAVGQAVVAAEAARAGFPDFDSWRNNKGSAA